MPYYGPHEPSHTILVERAFFAEIVMRGVGYGVQLVLYVMSVAYFWRERKTRRGVMLFLLAYFTLLLSLLSLWAAIGTWTIEDIYINNRNYPGGPWVYFNTASKLLPTNIVYFASIFSLTFLSDFLVLWRCWVIWTSSFVPRIVTYAVVLFPFVLLLASFALGIIWCMQISPPGHPFDDKTATIFATAYYATSISTNVVVTFLITLRLCLHRRKLLDTLPPDHAKQYLSIVAILVDSAALYSLVSLAFVISYALNSSATPIILGLGPPCQQIAGYLIILRVAKGRAWGLKTLGMTSDVGTQPPNTSAHTKMNDVESFRQVSTRESKMTAVSRSRSYQ